MKSIDFCIQYLLDYNNAELPDELSKEKALRTLMNITTPDNLDNVFYKEQDKALQEILSKKKIVELSDLKPVKGKCYIYVGDITLIKADAIVNSANKEMLGCFIPLHSCVDNAIHSYAGLEVRRDLMKMLSENPSYQPVGHALITKGYNLPSRYIIHTVGPTVFGRNPTEENINELRNCYLACMNAADKVHAGSIVFPSISTGVYRFPKKESAHIAIKAVDDYLKEHPESTINKVVFNLFNENALDIYKHAIEEI